LFWNTELFVIVPLRMLITGLKILILESIFPLRCAPLLADISRFNFPLRICQRRYLYFSASL